MIKEKTFEHRSLITFRLLSMAEDWIFEQWSRGSGEDAVQEIF